MSTLGDMLHAFVWGVPMLVLMLGTGLYFTIKFKLFQISRFGAILKAALPRRQDAGARGRQISSFQALATSLAGVLGIGNILGVTSAIAVAGPGAIFWMWVSAFFGMAAKYAETVLSMKYRRKNKNGCTVGGPMYYLEDGLGLKTPAVLFAAFCLLASLIGMGNATQVAATADAVHSTLGVPVAVTGIGIALVVGKIISGGIQTTGRVMAWSVPVISALYFILGIAAIVLNRHNLPGAVQGIFKSAFSLRSVGGGVGGYAFLTAMKYGFARGVFSNEAGLGTSPIVHAASDGSPVQQGLCGAFEVFFDTMIMASVTALMVLCSDSYLLTRGTGMELTSAVFAECFGVAGKFFIAGSLLFFAAASMPGWYYFGEKSLEYLAGGRTDARWLRYLYIAVAAASPLISLDAVWKIADTANGLMALPNLLALILLRKVILEESRRNL